MVQKQRFTQNISLSLYQLNEKMDSISILVKNKNDGRYIDHLVTTGQISSVYAIPLSLYTLEDIHIDIITYRQFFARFKKKIIEANSVVDPNYIRRPLTVVWDELSQKLMMHSNIYETLFYP